MRAYARVSILGVHIVAGKGHFEPGADRMRQAQHDEGSRERERATKLQVGTALLDSTRGPAGPAG